MKEVCNHKSVGMMVEREGKILLIERKIFPPGFALPAGHVDEGEDFETAAARELKEEVGLTATSLTLVKEGRKENPCSRPGGSWHDWKIYKIEAEDEVVRSEEETKQAGWYTPAEIKELNLEPVMREWFTELGII